MPRHSKDNFYDDIRGDLSELVGAEKADRIIRMFASRYGGSAQYFPKNSVDLTFRNDSIVTRFNGRNESALAREFGISKNYILKIVANYRK